MLVTFTKMIKFKNILLTTLAFFLSSATIVSSQSYLREYNYTYDLTPAQASSLFAGFGIVWVAVMCCALIFGIAIYIFTSFQLAKIFEKNGMKDQKVLAFIPIVQNYYLAKAVGEDKYAWAQLVLPAGILFSIPLCFILIGYCILLPLSIALFIFNIMLWLKASKRMGRDDVWGIAASLAGLIPFVGLFLQLYAVYYIAEGEVK